MSPLGGQRRPTPLLPAFGTLYSSITSKSPYSFSVRSQPPPGWPVVYRMPSPAPQQSILAPSFTVQPVRSLPLNSDSKPSGGFSSAAQTAGSAQQASARADRNSTQRRIGMPPG